MHTIIMVFLSYILYYSHCIAIYVDIIWIVTSPTGGIWDSGYLVCCVLTTTDGMYACFMHRKLLAYGLLFM